MMMVQPMNEVIKHIGAEAVVIGHLLPLVKEENEKKASGGASSRYLRSKVFFVDHRISVCHQCVNDLSIEVTSHDNPIDVIVETSSNTTYI
eukprot:scaffold24661_cov132-Cylindrotheca_fusiformis.AAC.3